MSPLSLDINLILAALASWMDRRQRKMIDYATLAKSEMILGWHLKFFAAKCTGNGAINTELQREIVVIRELCVKFATERRGLSPENHAPRPVHHTGQNIKNEDLEGEDVLVSKAQKGDESAFIILIRAYKPRIFGMASKFGRDPEEVRDLAQEISVELWKGIRAFKRNVPFEHWLSRVATNRCMRFLRRNYRRRSMEVVGTGTCNDNVRDLAAELPDETTHRHREAAEARELLALALARLSAKDALVIILKEVEGRSVADIARDTGWGEGTVKVRALRARGRLRKILEDLGEA